MQTTLGQLSLASGELVVVDCGLLGDWDSAAHLPAARAAAGGDHRLRFGGVEGVVLGGLAPATAMVQATPRPDGSGWLHVDVVLGELRQARSAEPLGRVLVDCARLLVGELGALEAWGHDQSQDGLADVAFWGRDAAAVAAEVGAPRLPEEGVYGWADMPLDQAEQWVAWLDQHKAGTGRLFAADFRPHDHHFKAMALVRASPAEAGMVEVAGARCVVFSTRQGDGVFPVFGLRSATGELVAVRIALSGEHGLPEGGAPPPELPPDPAAAVGAAVKQAAVNQAHSMAQSALQRAFYTRVKRVLPRWAWPLLPDGKTGWGERAAKLGKEKLIGAAVGCAFTGCLMVFIGGGLLGLFAWIGWTVYASL